MCTASTSNVWRLVVACALVSYMCVGAAQPAVQPKQPEYYFQHWCNNEARSLQYLDDANCAKVFPLPSSAAAAAATSSSSSSSSIDRNWDCSSGSGSPALNATELLEQGYQFDVKLGERTTVDLFSLQPFVENGDDEDATGTVNICLIVTRRVVAGAARDNEGKGEMLMHKYFCNGAESALNAHETWSSSKVFAIANAAGALREREGKEGQEGGEKGIFGIQSSTTGKHGVTPLGDLSTIVCSYDTTEGYSSNSLSSYFHDIGWRSFANALVNTTAQTQTDDAGGNSSWCGALRGAQPQSLGGNYGEPTPPDLGFAISQAADSGSNMATKTVTAVLESPPPPLYTNTLSSLTAAEMARRIVQHRSLPQDMRFPGMQWQDAQNILYGEESSLLFPSLHGIGGMSVDPAIFLQSSIQDLHPQAFDFYGASFTAAAADSSSAGNVEEDITGHEEGLALPMWRIFSKLGAGWSSSRGRGEIISTAYACLPKGMVSTRRGSKEADVEVEVEAEAEAETGANGNLEEKEKKEEEEEEEGRGYEFTISARGSVPGDTSLELTQAKVKAAVDATVAALLRGQLPI